MGVTTDQDNNAAKLSDDHYSGYRLSHVLRATRGSGPGVHLDENFQGYA